MSSVWVDFLQFLSIFADGSHRIFLGKFSPAQRVFIGNKEGTEDSSFIPAPPQHFSIKSSSFSLGSSKL